MTEVKTSDDFAGLAKNLNMQAIAILQDSKATAEDIEKSEKMREEAASYMRRSDALKTLESQFQDARNKAVATEELEDAELKKFQRLQAEEGMKFKSAGEFFKRVVQARKGMLYDSRLVFFNGGEMNQGAFSKVSNQKDMAENIGASGGFLVPPDFRPEILQLAQE